MDGTRSTKRRRLSPPNEGVPDVQARDARATSPKPKGKLKRIVKRNAPGTQTEDEESPSARTEPATDEKPSSGRLRRISRSKKAEEDGNQIDVTPAPTHKRPSREHEQSDKHSPEVPAQANTKRKDTRPKRSSRFAAAAASSSPGPTLSDDLDTNNEKEDDDALNPGTLETRKDRPARRRSRRMDGNGIEDEETDLVETPAARIAKPTTKRNEARKEQAQTEVSGKGEQIETPNSSPAKASRRLKSTAKNVTGNSEATASTPGTSSGVRSGGKQSAIHTRIERKRVPEAMSDEDELFSPAGNQTPEPAVAFSTSKTPAKIRGRVNNAMPENGESNPTDSSLNLLKTIVLEKLNGRRQIPLIGIEPEYHKVYQLVEQTIDSGEGNSMLVIGARGSGKTSLVKRVLGELAKERRQDFHIVRLNGFIHTDDKIALREIWRQLGKEMDIEDNLGKNYADTLSTLLALLSHPSELAGQESDEVAKAVIFVMDEFDLFASHPRQTLLYNLFDIAQSRKAPIAVLGLTTRIGVADSLEKRVKSRFSHRYVHLSLARNFDSFQEICKAALLLTSEDMSVQESSLISKTGSRGKKASEGPNLLNQWNGFVENIFADPAFKKHDLAPFYHLGKSIPAALTSFQLPIRQLSSANFPPQPGHFSNPQSLVLQAPDSKLSFLPSLTDLQLALLISAARLDIIHDTDTCNFNMVYAEYVSLASRAKIQSAASGAIASGAGTKVWGRDVARGEWERLIEWDLVIPVVGAANAGSAAATAMVRIDVALEEIAPSVPGIDRVMERWCKHI